MGLDDALADFVTVLRRAGLRASAVESIDAQRAAMAVGVGRREDLREALRAVLVKDVSELPAFDRTFDAFFRTGAGSGTGAIGTLLAEGATHEEIAALLRAIEAQAQAEGRGAGGAMSAVAAGGAELDERLRQAARAAGVDRIRNPMQVGLFTLRVLEAFGAAALSDELGRVRMRLRDELGPRGDGLAERLAADLQQLRGAARAIVAEELERQSASLRAELSKRWLKERSFAELSPGEVKRVREEVARLAQRLRGRIAVRNKRRRRGRLDVRRTLRTSWRTSGVPFRPVFRRRRPERPKLVLVCDISESVRFAARFLLILVHAMQEVFARTRTFVFVSDLGETTELFEQHPVERAIDLAYGGAAIRVASNSDYGRALGVLAERYADAIDRRTLVVVLGDARTNFLDPNLAAWRRIRTRASRILWLNPEPRSSWGFGDSVMGAYLPGCDEALTVRNLETLREAVDRIEMHARS